MYITHAISMRLLQHSENSASYYYTHTSDFSDVSKMIRDLDSWRFLSKLSIALYYVNLTYAVVKSATLSLN